MKKKIDPTLIKFAKKLNDKGYSLDCATINHPIKSDVYGLADIQLMFEYKYDFPNLPNDFNLEHVGIFGQSLVKHDGAPSLYHESQQEIVAAIRNLETWAEELPLRKISQRSYENGNIKNLFNRILSALSLRRD